jgi:hypothetical protein
MTSKTISPSIETQYFHDLRESQRITEFQLLKLIGLFDKCSSILREEGIVCLRHTAITNTECNQAETTGYAMRAMMIQTDNLKSILRECEASAEQILTTRYRPATTGNEKPQAFLDLLLSSLSSLPSFSKAA